MNAHKIILGEMKCDRSFEILQLFTEGILDRVRRRQLLYLERSIPKPSETHPASQVRIDLLSDVMPISFGSRPLLP
jgi:hypothetical protein